MKNRGFAIFAVAAIGMVAANGCASEPAAPGEKPAAAPATIQAPIDPMIDAVVRTELNRNCLGTDDVDR